MWSRKLNAKPILLSYSAPPSCPFSTPRTMNTQHSSTTARQRKRLSTACDRCRRRKVRCDDLLPVCTNCSKAGTECVTRDLRNPNVPAQRREAQSRDGPVHERAPSDLSNLTPVESSTGIASGTPILAEQPTPDRDGLFVGPLPAIPSFTSGNSLSVLTQWLDLAFARLGLPERFSWQYRANGKKPRSHASPPAHYIEDDRLSWKPRNQPVLDHFKSTINQVFPVLDPKEVISTAESSTMISLFHRLVLAVGIASIQHSVIDLPSYMADTALSQLVPLIQDESIYSINSLILMVLLFRARGDSEMAWHMLANAVPKAQSLGLGRYLLVQIQSSNSTSWQHQRANTWWALYILDKMLSIELQRPTMIRDYLHDEELPFESRHSSCFHAIIRLAKIQGRVSDALLTCAQAEASGRITISQSINDKIQLSAELDQSMTSWVNDLPLQLRLV
jgi:hypothetical protein